MSLYKGIEERLSTIEAILASQDAHLKDHLRRTGVMERRLDPIETHVKNVQGAAKFIVLLATLGGAITALVKFVLFQP